MLHTNFGFGVLMITEHHRSFKSSLMVFLGLLFIYGALAFYSWHMRKHTVSPAPLLSCFFFLFLPLFSLLPWRCCRKWLILPTTVWWKHTFSKSGTDTDRCTETNKRRTTWLRSLSQTLITSRLQSKQLIATTSLERLIIDPTSSPLLRKFWESSFCTSVFPLSSLLTPLCSQTFCRHPAPLSSKLYANPCLDCRLTGFLQHLTPMT